MKRLTLHLLSLSLRRFIATNLCESKHYWAQNVYMIAIAKETRTILVCRFFHQSSPPGPYLIPNLHTVFQIIWFQTYLTPNISDSESVWFWMYLVPNLSDYESIWLWIYLIPNVSDSEPIWSQPIWFWNLIQVIWFWACLISNLSDSEPIWCWTYLISNPCDTQPIGFRMWGLFEADPYLIPNLSDSKCSDSNLSGSDNLILNLSDFKPIFFWTYLILYLSDSVPVWFRTYLILNLSDSKPIWYWTYQITNMRPVWHRPLCVALVSHFPFYPEKTTNSSLLMRPVVKLGTTQVNTRPLSPSSWYPPPTIPNSLGRVTNSQHVYMYNEIY